MSSDRPGPVVFYSYLAAAELWKVARFPLANDGAEVAGIEHSIAADGPMAAAVLAALGVPSLLLSNGIGSDVRGVAVRDWLQSHQVAMAAPSATGLTAPRIVVVADEAGTRTWFPYLPGVADALAAVDLTPLTSAAFAYIDCYRLIEAPAVRAIHAARAADVPVLLNLGGSPLSPVVTDAVRDHPSLVVQTNVDDVSHAEAPRVAALVLAATTAQWVVVTAGAYGVVALSRSECLSVPAYRVVVRHTHCAGAAFSGGLLYGLLHDWPMTESLHLACASGALRCERGHDEPLPALVELGEVIASAGRPAEIQSRSVAESA